MNRRGNIATVLLLIAAVILVGMALFAFSTFNNNLNSKSQEFNQLVTDAEFNQEYITYLAKKSAEDYITYGDFAGAIEENKIGIEMDTNFFKKVSSGDYSIDYKKGIFEMDGVSIKSAVGKSEIIRRFNLNFSFSVNWRPR